uniref:MYND-type domain-containing protein n=1 Tax=Ciona savignyi TaxID=51511 RepID=H2YF74_CIOSA
MAYCAICKVQQQIMKRCTGCKKTFYCSRFCQIEHWPLHKSTCGANLAAKTTEELVDNKVFNPIETGETLKTASVKSPVMQGLTICIHCNHIKHKLFVPSEKSPKEIFELLSNTVRIPKSKIKLIAKGKVVTEENVYELIFHKKIKVVMAVGEVAENEEGLNSDDIEMIMKQLDVSRNVAIKGLFSSGGNLIDAILLIGNSL